MPIHFNDLNIDSEIEGISSALIVPCQMCPAITVAVREKKPFIQLFKKFLKSEPFEQYMNNLQIKLKKSGVKTEVFWSYFPHHWFLCMWTGRQSKKLKDRAKQFEAVIALGCESTTETIRGALDTDHCKIIEGMAVTGIMNAKLRFQFPCDISFDDCKVIPISPNNIKGYKEAS